MKDPFKLETNETKINLDQLKLIQIPGKFKKTIITGNFDENLLKNLRKKLGCGGNICEEGLSLQGDHLTNKKLKKILDEEKMLNI